MSASARPPWADRITHHAGWYAGFSAVFMLLCVLLSISVFHGLAHTRAQATLQADVQRLAMQLDRIVNHGVLSGGLHLMGTTDDRIKDQLNHGRAVDLAARALALEADGLMLVDPMGRVVASWDPLHQRATAPTWSARAQSPKPGASVQNHMTQNHLTQVALETTSLEHSLLLVAPVWQGSVPEGSATIGTLVARLDPGTIRRLLSMPDARITLVAPNGRTVAASTAQGSLRQPAESSEATAPAGHRLLPQRHDGVGAARLVVRQTLGWHMPQAAAAMAAGDMPPHWSIVATKDLPPLDWLGGPHVKATVAGGLTIPLLMLLLFKFLRGRRDRRLAQQHLEEETRQAALRARWRAQVGDVAIALQDARTPQSVARTYLHLVHELVGTARGVVYSLRHGNSLQAIGHWACAVPPAERVEPGDGLIGQVARDRQPVEFKPQPGPPTGGPPTIRSALGQMEPGHRMVLPLMHMGDCLGVVELDWLSAAAPERRARVLELTELLALNLRLMRQQT